MDAVFPAAMGARYVHVSVHVCVHVYAAYMPSEGDVRSKCHTWVCGSDFQGSLVGANLD